MLGLNFREKNVICILIAVFVGLISAFVNGKLEAEFLTQLISSTVQILGFTGIIIGIVFPRLRVSTRDIQKDISEWTEVLGKSTSDATKEPIDIIIREKMRLLGSLQNMFVASLSRLYYGAMAFAVALITELLQLRMYGANFPVLPFNSNNFAFGIELGLLAFGLGMLVLGLVGTFRLAMQ